MKKTVIYLSILLLSLEFSFSQGYVYPESDEDLANIEAYSKASFGFADNLPARADLKKYVPNIGDQKDSGSCVAWSVSYYAMSIIYNKSYGITSSEGKWANRFDPWYLYNQLSFQNYNTCSEGLWWNDAFELAGRVGNKKITIPPYDLHCSKQWDIADLRKTISVTNKYRITKAEYLDPKDPSTINKIKYEIYKYSFPVVIGISHYGDGLNMWESTHGFFRPNYDANERAGHAMTIVGYDDSINGGSFLVVNSWGIDFGKNGYMWMNYNDFKKYTHRAYSLYVSFESLEKSNSDTFGRKSWDDKKQTYEGQISVSDRGWIENGYGVNYNSRSHTYSIGKWVNGKRHGRFYVVENKKWFKQYWNNGVRQNYGFAGDEEDDKLDSYLDSLFSSSDILSINE